MKNLATLFTLITLVMIFLFKIARTDAAALMDDKSSMVDSNASDEDDASLRSKKETNAMKTQVPSSSSLRRHHLKFGVLGKRYSYGYLGKRNDALNINDDVQEWLDTMRQRRAGRPQYGLLG